MEMNYNAVDLHLLQFDRVERVNVYDLSGIDLLYIRWLLGVTAVYSPNGGFPVGTAVYDLSDGSKRVLGGATTNPATGRPVVRRPGPPENETTIGVDQEKNEIGNLGRFGQGLPAIETDIELRTRLMIPRRPLTIKLHPADGKSFIWLQSPSNGYVCDQINGPKPISCDILEMTGEGRTFGIHYQIETATPPTPDGFDQVVLSHRWEMDHEPDANHYVTRTISGEIIFNTALLYSLRTPLNADWFRNQLIHPIPLGFRRLGPKVTMSADGSTLRYVVKDTDTPITFDAGDSGATQIEIIEKVNYTQPWRF